MDKDDARKKLRSALEIDHYSIAFSYHSKERRNERRYTTIDIRNAIYGGIMIKGPTKLKHVKGFECVMELPLRDGRKFSVPLVVDETARRIIVKSTVPRKRWAK
jgi:hypothetical protein